MSGAIARVRRKPERACYDAEAVHAVLDAAPFCHVATVRGGRPVVLPMAHARLGDTLVLHGSAAAGLFRDMRWASPVCVTATLFDGLVLGRSARNHSVNYRSVTVHGDATEVTDPDEMILALRWHGAESGLRPPRLRSAAEDHASVGREHLTGDPAAVRAEEPGDQRGDLVGAPFPAHQRLARPVRQPVLAELRDTGLWQVPIAEASVKARSGSTIDPPADLAWPVWAGHVPADLVFGEPVPAEGLPAGVDPSGRSVVLNPAFGHLARD